MQYFFVNMHGQSPGDGDGVWTQRLLCRENATRDELLRLTPPQEGHASSDGLADEAYVQDVHATQISSRSHGQGSCCHLPRRRSRRRYRPIAGQGVARGLVDLEQVGFGMPVHHADTVLLVGSSHGLLSRTAEMFQSSLPNTVTLGGVSACVVVVAGQVRCCWLQK